MKAEMNRQAEQYIRQNKNKRKVTKLVAILSVLVALLTTYILMLPGITMEYGMVCGLEEHQHSEACYAAGVICGLEERETVTTETVSMVCAVSPHEHSSDCFDSNNERICGMATELFHTHNDFCYDGEGKLICTLPVNAKHVHSESCYQTETQLTCQLEETAGHRHTEACKTQTAAAEPACGLAESAGHAHGDSCFAPDLSCSLAESAGHIHEESCHQIESTLVCTEAEAPAHSHEATCYNEQNELICGMEAGQGGHTHGESCYTQTDSLICGKEEGEGAHTHGDDCYTSKLICTIADGEGAHTHTESCYPMVETITCGMEAGQGAHAHGEECYTASEQLVCTLLHQHDGECVEKDNEGRECVICGMDEVPEHIHTETCREVTTSTIEGHTHTDECNGDVLVCQLTEHTHEDACYPQEEVVVTATPEPSATPEVSSEPTAEPTTEPTSLQDDTTYLCGIPEHRHSATCLDEAGTLICGYAEDHLHGELCLADLTDTVFYCGTEEHLHGFLCFGENNQLLCGVEDEHRHSYECLKDPSAITACYCGMEEHFHGELCYDENWALVCQATEHFHSADCYYACGKQEHVHSATAAGGMMLLSLEESYGCYDAEGKLVCGLEEHLHSDGCNIPANDSVKTLEENATGSLKLDSYVTGCQTIVNGVTNGAEYDPNTGFYSTKLQLSYQIPNSILKSNPNLVFDLADGVIPNAKDIGIELSVMNGNIEMGTWKIVEVDGKYQIQITIKDDYLKNADSNTTSTGTLSFNAQLDSKLVQENGSIQIPVTTDKNILIPENNITYPNDNERPGADITSNKRMSHREGNCLYYTVQVSSKQGTPGPIQFVDQLTLSGIGTQFTVESIKLNNQETNVEGIQPQITDNETGKTVTMTLPQLEANSNYEIKYKVQLDNPTALNTNAQIGNRVTVSSPAGEDPDIKHTSNTSNTYTPDVLYKVGNYPQNAEFITWTITVNKDNLNIAGYTLNDSMLGAIVDGTLVIKDANGNAVVEGDSTYNVQYGNDGKISGIVFNGTENKNQYVIEYQTKPTQNFTGAYSEKNVVVLQKDNDIVSKDASVWVDRQDTTAKSNTGSAANPNNANERIVDWKNSITIPSYGLGENLVVTDTLNNTQYHTMTVEQAKALYQNLMSESWFSNASGGKLTLTDTDNQQYEITNIDQFDSLNTNGFIKFSYELDYTQLSSYNGQNLSYTYQTTANIENVTEGTSGYFGNELKVNEKSVSAQYQYQNIQIRPVQKVGSNYNGSLTTFDSTSQSLKWIVQICMNEEDNDVVVVTDALPASYVELKNIVLPVGNGTLTLGDQQSDGTYRLVFTDGNASDDNEMNADFSGSYCPDTGIIQLTITKKSDSRFFKIFNGQWYEGRTPPCEGLINLEFNCDIKSLPEADENNLISLINTVDVDVDGEDHGSASHTYQTTPKKLVVKKDRNGSEADISEYHEITDQKIKWTVEVYQDKNYDTLIIKDTLPKGVVLDYIETGSWGNNTKIYYDGTDCTISNGNNVDIGVFNATYNADNRQIEVTAGIAEAISKNYDNNTYGAGKTLKLTVYCTITDEFVGITEGNNEAITRSFEFKNQVDVKAKETSDSTPTDYGSDDQTTKGTVKWTKPVRKTDLNGSSDHSSITTQNGEVGWLVEIKQQDTYEKIIITDTLDSAQVDLLNIQIRHAWENRYFSLATLGTVGADGLIPLVIDHDFGNQTNMNASGTYDPATGQVRIELSVKDANNGNNNYYGNGKTIVLRYNCKVKDSMMPDVYAGQLSAGSYAIANQVVVDLDDTTYTDSQQQNVTVEIPFTAGAKSHTWEAGKGKLTYLADINPMAMDLNPQGDKLTVIDSLSISFNNNHNNSDDDDINLSENSVKLYYADYDQYGNPVFDENGRLKKGNLVPFTEWEMSYEESQDPYYSRKKDRVMNMRVPDGKALVLEYEYLINMPKVESDQPIPQVTNKVSIKEAPDYQFSHQTSSEDKWHSSDALATLETDSYSIKKYDANNQALTLAGTQFDVYGWNADTQIFTKLHTYTTDGYGAINISKAGTDGLPQYNDNTAYYLVETNPSYGYVLPEDKNEYYFYWENAESETFTGPENFLAEYAPTKLNDGATLNIPNTKESTYVAIQKEWKDQNGNPLTEDLPEYVTVNLKRYAVKESEWKEDFNKGTLTSETVDVTIGLYGDGDGKQVNYQIPMGATLFFDIEITNTNNSDAINHRPVFDAPVLLIKTEKDGEGTTSIKYTYHYKVKLDQSTNIKGELRRIDNNNIYYGSNFVQDVAFVNKGTTGGLYIATPDTLAQLEQYKDDTFGKTQNLYASGNWYASWDNLDIKKTVDGVNYRYKYYIEEVPVDGFASTITGGSNDDGGMFVITNTKDGSYRTYTSIHVQKKWLDENGQPVTDTAHMPPIEVQLYRKDMSTGAETLIVDSNGAGITLNENSDWEYYYKELPLKTYRDGVLVENYTYRVTEIVPSGYNVTFEVLDSNGNPLTGSNANAGLTGGTVIMTNSAKETTDVVVKKEWANGVPSENVQIEVELSRKVYENGEYSDASIQESENITTKVTLPKSNQWEHTWTNLPAADEAGNSYQYDVTETKVTINGADVTAQYEQEKTTQNGVTTIINKAASVTLTLQKRWQNAAGQDVPVGQAQSVYIKLYKNNEDITARLTSDQLAEGVQIIGEGKKYLVLNTAAGSALGEISIVNLEKSEDIVYTVKEFILEEGQYKEEAPRLVYGSDDTATGMTNSGIVQVINVSDEQLTAITIAKQWLDADGKTLENDVPASVQFKLYRKTTNGDPEIVKENGVDKLYSLPDEANGQWQTIISDLPVQDTNGELYTYYVVEEPVEGFETSYSKQLPLMVDGKAINAGEAENGSVTITNKELPTTVVTARKVWKAASGTTTDAPNGVNVELQLYQVAMDQETWQQYVNGLQQGETPDTPTEPDDEEGDEGGTTEPTAPVTLTFDLNFGGNVFASLTYGCNKGEEFILEIAYTGKEAVHHMNLNHAGGFIEASGASLSIPLNAADTQESHTITVYVSCNEGACVSEEWSISRPSSSSNSLQRSSAFTPPTGVATPIGAPIILPDADGSWNHQWPEQVSKIGDTYYAYYVQETAVSGYTTTYDATYNEETGTYSFTVTNTKSELEPTTIQLTVTKQWQDADGNALNNPSVETVQFKLYRKTAGGTAEVVQENDADKLYSLTAANGQWQTTISGLPATDAQGNSYTYYVVEEPVEGFEATYNKQTPLTVNGEAINAGEAENGSVTITNKELPTTVVTASKVWKDADGAPMDAPGGASVTLQLYRNTLTEEEWKQFVQEQQQPEELIAPPDNPNNVTLTFNLVNTNSGNTMPFHSFQYSCQSGGKVDLKIAYTGTGTIWDIRTSNIGGDKDGKYIVFSLKSEDTSIDRTYTINIAAEEIVNDASHWTITNISSNPNNLRSTTSTDWSQQGNPQAEPIGSPVPLQNTNWSYMWPPQVQRNGTEYYYYYVRETAAPAGYTAAYDYSWDDATGNYTYTVTNTKSSTSFQKTGSLTVNKTWIDQTTPTEVQFEVYRIARPKTSADPVKWVPVTFTISASGQQASSVTQYIPENANVTWKPKWTVRGDFHPSNNVNQGEQSSGTNTVTYNSGGNYFVEGTKSQDGNWYDYSFQLGSIGSGGNAQWTTNNKGYVNDTNTDSNENVFGIHYWSNEFTLDNEQTGVKVAFGSLTNVSQSFNDLVFEDENYTYRYVVKEIGTDYVVSYDYNQSSETQQSATINNYTPKRLKLKLKKLWANADGTVMDDSPDKYYIKYQLKFGKINGDQWNLYEGNLTAGENGSWELDVTDVIFENHDMAVEELGVIAGDGTDVSALYVVEYSIDGQNWNSTPTWATPDAVQDTTLYIRNKLKPTYVLPETGGTGTHLYTCAGALLAGMALMLLYRSNQGKRRANE